MDGKELQSKNIPLMLFAFDVLKLEKSIETSSLQLANMSLISTFSTDLEGSIVGMIIEVRLGQVANMLLISVK